MSPRPAFSIAPLERTIACLRDRALFRVLLGHLYVFSSRAFRAFAPRIFDRVAFAEVIEFCTLNRCAMEEEFVSAGCDEAEALV